MPKVACTALSADTGPHLDIFAKAGFDVTFTPPGMNPFHEDHLIQILSDCDAVVAGSEPYTRRVFDALPKLRVIARSGVGFDAIDLKAADDHNVVVATTPGVNHHSVAEHAIALLMGVARGFPRLDQDVRVGRWRRFSYPRVAGRTLGLLGLGRIGQAVATRGVGLGMKVIAYEPYPNAEFNAKWGIELVDVDTLLARSDFVSLHMPMSAENRNFMNRERFAKMKPGSVLINTARGQLVEENDLCDAINSGHLAGAGLDVFQVEPLPLDSPLLKVERILVSGHIAGLDDESKYDTSKMYAEIIVGLRDGKWPEGCVQNLKGRTGWKW
jgi:phosphoglycerate dehydrogenase-like enzyme